MSNALLEHGGRITEGDYLSAETRGEVKHEFVGGAVYAMAGASETHNRVASNLIGMLYSRLRGSRCEAFGSDMKLRMRPLGETGFYYPDAMVVCDPADSGHGWREKPALLFEIVSEETRRVDEREKRFAYLQLASLDAYIRIEQGRPEVVVEQRTKQGWMSTIFAGLDAIAQLPLESIALPLRDLYERVVFID